MLKDFTIANMLDMTQTIAGELFQGKTYPWEVLPEIGDFIVKLGKTLDPDEYDYLLRKMHVLNVFDQLFQSGRQKG